MASETVALFVGIPVLLLLAYHVPKPTLRVAALSFALGTLFIDSWLLNRYLTASKTCDA